MEWHWELVVTYEFQYQYIRRCSHLDGPLCLSLPDSDWYHLINMQGHRGEGRENRHLFFDALSYQSLRILRFSLIIYKDKDAWQWCHNGRETNIQNLKFDCPPNLFNFKKCSHTNICCVLTTSKHSAKIPEILRQQVIKSKARRDLLSRPISHYTRDWQIKASGPWLLSCALIG